MPGELTWLACAWTIWCALHSLLAWPPVVAAIQRRLGRYQGAYRLLYNLFALVSLAPVGLLYRYIDGPPVLVWPNALQPLLWMGYGLAFWLFLTGALAYSLSEFLGLAQLQAGRQSVSKTLAVSGALGHVRHPWYLSALIFLWCRELAAKDLVTAILLSGYLWLGTVFEERRLVVEFGDTYRHYQAAVPRFWPRLWRRRQKPPLAIGE